MTTSVKNALSGADSAVEERSFHILAETTQRPQCPFWIHSVEKLGERRTSVVVVTGYEAAKVREEFWLAQCLDSLYSLAVSIKRSIAFSLVIVPLVLVIHYQHPRHVV